jgi:copper homeostasis protein
MELEICVDSVESAIAAECGGAQRIELCSGLAEGGITPSAGLIRSAREPVSIDLVVMIRPRGGDFVYTDCEFGVIREDILSARALGANGVALGLLTPEGQVDVERTRRLVQLARPMQVTFHRAFDFIADRERGLEDVIACGADRVLTSGGAADANRGAERIAHLNRQAGDRIRVMAGGGIRENNVAELLRKTSVREVHTSLNKSEPAPSRSVNPLAGIGARYAPETTFRVREEDVRAMRAALLSFVQ